MPDKANPDEPFRIPIRLAGKPGLPYSVQPLTFGVPFADGALAVGTPLRAVTEDGRELPLQAACMTTWNKDLKFVKWLLVDTQVDPARDGETVWLEQGGRASRPANPDAAGVSAMESRPAPSISTTTADGILTIDTGALRLRLRTDFALWKHRENDSVFAGCEMWTAAGWQSVWRDEGLVLYMADGHGNRYVSSGISPAPRVILEEEGALRVCVRIDGHLRSEAGVLFCPYRLRLHLYAGRTEIRVFHTFVFNQDPTRVELSGIGLKVLACPGDGAVAAVGTDDSNAGRTDLGSSPSRSDPALEAVRWSRNFESLSLLQSDDLNYAVNLDGSSFGEGEKAPGWASLGGAKAGLLAVIRDCWQEYPKGLHIGRDTLDLRIWPEDCPRTLSFMTPLREPCINFRGTRDEEEVKRLLAENPTAPLWLSSFHAKTEEEFRWVEKMVDCHAPGRIASYNDVGTDNGVGAAKTTEILLQFAPEPVSSTDAAATAAAVQSPLVAVVDPAYLCGTGAVDHLLPSGDPRFVNADAAIDDGHFEFCIMDPVERYRLYGMMRHGNLINNHGNSPDFLHHFYRDSAPEKVLRFFGAYNNEARDHILAVWCHFLRTGKPEYLRAAQLASRSAADVGFVHAYPDDPDRVGVSHYHNLHVWSGVLCRSHSIIGGIMLDYYMTGNRRLLDVAMEAADHVVHVQNPSGTVNCFYGNSLNREFVGPLSILMEAYRATWAEKYGLPAERSLAWLLRVVPKPGYWPRDIYTVGARGDEAIVSAQCASAGFCGNHYNMYAAAWRLFPSEALRTFLVANADYWVWDAPFHAGSLSNAYDSTVLCLAYDLTGNADYAVRAMDLLSRYRPADPEVRKQSVRNFVQYLMSGFLPRLMRTVAAAMDRDADGFAERQRLWREKREQMPDLSPSSPSREEIRLGRISTVPFPPEIRPAEI